MIDIVIPTMWGAQLFEKTLETYVSHPNINSVIIIDNAKNKRPSYSILKNSKIRLVSYGKNIYVNPAWNEGYIRSTSDILAIINDDILVSHDVFNMVADFDLKDGDLIGVNLRGRQDNYKIDDFIDTEESIVKLNYDRASPIGGQAWAFGICMFMLRKSYSIIPSLYQIWYGDDYLAQRANAVYAINSNKIKGTISETLKKFNNPNDEISKRIELDSLNLLRFDDFENGKNWDIPKNMIAKYASERKFLSGDTFSVEYETAKLRPSDINENLHILYDLARQCKAVVEMGVRTGVSTRAFLNTNVQLTSYDIVLNRQVQDLFNRAKALGKSVKYIEADVLKIVVDETDLLFIDTLHTYDQLKQELRLHGNKAKKFIAFHDTHTFGINGEDQKDKKGLLPAIIEFMIDNPHWKFKIHKTNNNGMTVLERV